MKSLFPALLAAVVALAIWHSLRPQWQVRVRVRPPHEPVIEGTTKAKRVKIRHFLLNDVPEYEPMTLYITRFKNGRLKLTFRGRLHPGTKQQIRNFLIDLL